MCFKTELNFTIVTLSPHMSRKVGLFIRQLPYSTLFMRYNIRDMPEYIIKVD